MIAERLDHVHLGVRSLAEWAPLFRDLFGLEVIRGVVDPNDIPADPGRDMVVSEYQIGDGFVALLQPHGERSQIQHFLDRRGEGFYALSFDVGNLDDAAEELKRRGVPFIDTRRADVDDQGSRGFLWISPSFTKGVAVQLTWPWSMEQGANANLVGLSSAVVAVADIDAVLPAYRELLDLEERERVRNDRFGYEAAVLSIGNSSDVLVIAQSTDPEKPLGQHLAAKGASIFQFTITAKDLKAEVARLRAAGASVEVDDEAAPALAWLDTSLSHGARIELAQA